MAALHHHHTPAEARPNGTRKSYTNVVPPPADYSERLPIYKRLVREIYDDMTRRNPDSIPSVRLSAAKGQAWKHLKRAGW